MQSRASLANAWNTTLGAENQARHARVFRERARGKRRVVVGDFSRDMKTSISLNIEISSGKWWREWSHQWMVG